ncbi:hypothetical protein MKJ04_13160 [Pontibacter sp. E15-1]|uniref:hypothetical protein n=1 Tax=Pontibacter sp. E15-1 TaxID=2919918 RepID=UPI001F502E2E|nr:hypothetical protein [Pontibacter sp. E15-1]MCJ8165795.1 hypothetical protein [Pontibacter sp. E15-1]
METNKSLQEAILQAHPSTEKINQPQDLLFSIASPKQETYTDNSHHAPLNESHLNLMQSWMNLRDLECKLAESMPGELSDKPE